MTDYPATPILRDAFTRVHEDLPRALAGLGAQALLWRPDAEANPIGWLAWHMARGQDVQVADVAGRAPVYTSQGFLERFALPYSADAIGYGQTSAEVGEFAVVDGSLLLEYYAAVHAMTLAVIEPMTAADYDRIVDTTWDPPVTAAVRLVSTVNDVTQHLGQIGYLRGLWERR